jgi:hypothetical protein
MKNPSSRAVLFAFAAAACLQAGAAVHQIDVGNPLPRFGLVKEGTHHYLRYMKSGDANTAADIWTREVHFEQRNGERLMHIRQRWDGVGPTPTLRLLDSWFEPGTFRPLTHERTSERDGKRVVEGFVFAPTRVTGMKELPENTQKDLLVESPEPTYNFETDIEFLQALPLAEGYEAHINFYHPGGPSAPQRYTFRVAGTDTIAGPAGPVDCWLVTTDYNKPGTVSKFWFAKATQLMVRQESTLAGGKVLVKTMID